MLRKENEIENGLVLRFLSKDEERLLERMEKLPFRYKKILLELTELVVELQE